MTSLLRAGKRLFTAKDGASAAEFALVVPGFMLLLLAVLEFARVFFVANTLQFAVAQAARYVATSPGTNGRPTLASCQTGSTWTPGQFQTSITTYVQAQLTAWSLSSATPTVSTPQLACGESPPSVTVTVSATYPFTFWLTGLSSLLSTPSLTQQATVKAPVT
jgi:Flp pilus assembly protein TadG